MHWNIACIKAFFVLFGHGIRSVRRECEDGSQEGAFHLVDILGKILQERFVVYAPTAVIEALVVEFGAP